MKELLKFKDEELGGFFLGVNYLIEEYEVLRGKQRELSILIAIKQDTLRALQLKS